MIWSPAQSPLSLMQLYGVCDIVALPNRSESSCAGVLYAWAARKAVITSDLEGYLDIVGTGSNGYTVQPTVSGLTWALEQCMNASDAEIVAMGENGRVTAAFEHSWAKITDWTLGVYSELIGPLMVPKEV